MNEKCIHEALIRLLALLYSINASTGNLNHDWTGVHTHSSTSVTCDNSQGCCANREIEADEVYCRAYDGCKNSNISVNDACYCSGDDGCYQSKIDGNNAKIECSGKESCQLARITASKIECNGYSSCNYSCLQSSSIIECGGYYGCSYASISATQSLSGSGYKSCEYASVEYTPEIYATGDYSFENSVISSNAMRYLTIVADGVYPMNNSVLYCSSFSTCNVICGSGSSCEGLIYYCDTSGKGAVCKLNCDNNCINTNTNTICPEIIYQNFVKSGLGLKRKSNYKYNINVKKETESKNWSQLILQLDRLSESIVDKNNSNYYKNSGDCKFIVIIAVIEGLVILFGVIKQLRDKDVKYDYSLVPDP